MATRLPEAEGSGRGEGPNDEEGESNMSLGNDRHQNPAVQAELPLGLKGEAPRDQRSGESRPAVNGDERSGNDHLTELMEKVVEGSNAKAALRRVKQNKGSPGSDGIARYPVRARPDDPTVHSASVAADLRPDFLGAQPRLPAWAPRA